MPRFVEAQPDGDHLARHGGLQLGADRLDTLEAALQRLPQLIAEAAVLAAGAPGAAEAVVLVGEALPEAGAAAGAAGSAPRGAGDAAGRDQRARQAPDGVCRKPERLAEGWGP